MADNQVRIIIAADGSAAISGIKGVTGALDGMEKHSGGIVGKMKQHWLGLSAAAVSAYLAISKSFSFINESIAAANAQEEAEKRLTVALGHRSQALIDQASAIQQMTTYEDDAVIRSQAMIAMFVKDEAQIKKATEATLNLAAAKGMDLTSAADLVAKTLGSSTNALARYGVQVEGAVGSNERLTATVESINRVFGGQAAVAADTYGGKVVMLKNAWGDMKEELGRVVTDNRFMIETTGILQQAIQDLTKWIGENKQMLMELVKGGVLFAIDAFTLLVKVLDKAAAAWRWLKEGAAIAAASETALYENTTLAAQVNTEALRKANEEKAASWKALIDRLETMREKIAAVQAEEKKTSPSAGGAGGSSSIAEDAAEKAKRIEAEVKGWAAVAEGRVQENEEAVKAISDHEKKRVAEEDAAREYSAAKWSEYYQEQIDERDRVVTEGYDRWLKAELALIDIAREQKALIFDSMMANTQQALGAIGANDITANVGMLGALASGEDPYTKDFERWKELQDQKVLYLLEIGASEAQLQDAYRQYDLQQEQMQQQQKLALASSTFGMMAGLAQGFYAASGNQNKAAFELMKAMRIGETVMNTYSAAVGAYNAMAGIPIVGPVLGAAAAAAAIAFGMAQVRSISSMKPGGGVVSASAPSISASSLGASGAQTVPEQKETEKSASPIVNVHVYGNIVDHDAFARELVPSITKAISDGVQ